MGFKGQKKVFQKGQNKDQRGPGPKYSCHPVELDINPEIDPSLVFNQSILCSDFLDSSNTA